MAPIRQPWAVLVCRFSDDKDPADVLVRDLPGNDPGVVSPDDPQTALDLFKMFFTKQGNDTFNAVRYFNEMSHGAVDLNDSQVFIINLDMTKAQGALKEPYTPAQGAAYEKKITQAAQDAAMKQGVPLQNFYGIVITSHSYLSMAQGGSIPGGAKVPKLSGWAGMDYRWVRNHGIQSWGQEMGHGYGLDHSRSEGIPIGPDGKTPDYTDMLDVMSTQNSFSGPDPSYAFRGPGINAWNMRSRRWLDESRVWHCPHDFFDETLQLRPLHRKDIPGFLAAELPPTNDTDGFPRYLVEYRKKENWDNGIPFSCVSVHRFEGKIGNFEGTHSYVMKGTEGQYSLVVGERFAPKGIKGPRLFVSEIDDDNSIATVRLIFSRVAKGSLWHVEQAIQNGNFGMWELMGDAVGLADIAVSSNADGRLEVFATDSGAGLAWHISQVAPNGGWSEWERVGSAKGLGRIALGRKADGRLEVFATDTAAGLAWHAWQFAANGYWSDWERLGSARGLGQIAVASNADGRIEVLALDTADKLAWRTWQLAPSGGWSEWGRVGNAKGLGRIVLGRNTDGRLEAFATDTAAGLAWHAWQVAANGYWGDWERLGSARGLGQIAVASDADGRLEMFATDTAAGLAWHISQVAPNGGWSEWERVGSAKGLRKIALGSNVDGRLGCFAVDASDRLVWYASQVTASGDWQEWDWLRDAKGLEEIAVGQNADGRLNLFATIH